MASVDWFWLSFVDETDGHFLGVVVVDVRPDDRWEALAWLAETGRIVNDENAGAAAAAARAWQLGINPGGQVECYGPLPPDMVAVTIPDAYRRRLLTEAEAVFMGGGK